MSEEHLYLVQRSRAKKLWLVMHPGGIPRFPRVVQIAKRALCLLIGHDWSDWETDDYDGPGVHEYYEDGSASFVPYCSRKAEPNEDGHRGCSVCSAIERRWSIDKFNISIEDVPNGELVLMED